MSNASWTAHNIARKISFGKCRLYVNTGQVGTQDQWHKVDFNTLTLKPATKTFPHVVPYMAPYSSGPPDSGISRGFNYSQSYKGSSYSPYKPTISPQTRFPYLNGKYPVKSIATYYDSVPSGLLLASLFFLPCWGYPIVSEKGIALHTLIYPSDYSGGSYGPTGGSWGVELSVAELKSAPSTDYGQPPQALGAARYAFDRIGYLGVNPPLLNEWGDLTEGSPTIIHSTSNPVGVEVMFPSPDYADPTLPSQIISIKPATKLVTGGANHFVIERCNVPANSTDFRFPATHVVDLGETMPGGLTTQFPNLYTWIKPDFSKVVAATAYSTTLSPGVIEWRYRVYTVEFGVSASHTDYFIGTRTGTNSFSAGILWLDDTEIVFGVNDDLSCRILRNNSLVLSTTPEVFLGSDISPSTHQWGGHLESDQGPTKSVGYFRSNIVGRNGNTFAWLHAPSNPDNPGYGRILCAR